MSVTGRMASPAAMWSGPWNAPVTGSPSFPLALRGFDSDDRADDRRSTCGILPPELGAAAERPGWDALSTALPEDDPSDGGEVGLARGGSEMSPSAGRPVCTCRPGSTSGRVTSPTRSGSRARSPLCAATSTRVTAHHFHPPRRPPISSAPGRRQYRDASDSVDSVNPPPRAPLSGGS